MAIRHGIETQALCDILLNYHLEQTKVALFSYDQQDRADARAKAEATRQIEELLRDLIKREDIKTYERNWEQKMTATQTSMFYYAGVKGPE